MRSFGKRCSFLRTLVLQDSAWHETPLRCGTVRDDADVAWLDLVRRGQEFTAFENPPVGGHQEHEPKELWLRRGPRVGTSRWTQAEGKTDEQKQIRRSRSQIRHQSRQPSVSLFSQQVTKLFAVLPAEQQLRAVLQQDAVFTVKPGLQLLNTVEIDNGRAVNAQELI